MILTYFLLKVTVDSPLTVTSIMTYVGGGLENPVT